MLDFDDMARREITSGSAAIAMRFLARYTEPFARLCEPAAIKAVVSEIKLPVNVMAYPGLPSTKELEKLGVHRLSSGTGIPQMIWNRVAELAKGFLATGDSKLMFENSMAYSKLQKLFTR